MKSIILLFTCILFAGCKHGRNQSRDIHSEIANTSLDSLPELEKNIYLKIDEIHVGKLYINKNKKEVFYRLLVIPEEENIMLVAENIQIGDEGGSYKLLKTVRLTNNGLTHPKSNLYKVDSLKFIDSVTIQGYFNGIKKSVNFENLKPN
ncbi:MAG: hypothetical protein JWQ57_1220 [Mucilaginibacter sp.]|nr:hypothetical protein [Mucilaginibacter sp.]